MLRIEHLTKSYANNSVKAVDDLSLELKAGEIFGFLGPNGAGKTTTIKAITGILPFESGSVHIAGHNIVTDSIAAKSSFGYVSDSHILYDKLTGREYIDFMADIYGVSLELRKQRAEALLDKFQLKDAFDQPIKSYSHGMKQKINVIGALIHNPKLWILDEPMTGLDPQSSFELKNLMREHCKEGNTVFFSTHVLEVAEKLCDRVGIIYKGKLLTVGSLEEIKAQSHDGSLEEFFLSVTGSGEQSEVHA